MKCEATLDDHGRCTLLVDGAVQWQVDTGAGPTPGNPFREALSWPEGAVVVVGSGATAIALSRARGDVLGRRDVPDGFGHFAAVTSRTRGPLLLILGWCHVQALDTRLELVWSARDLAIDGLLLLGCDGDTLRLSAELDPPGGWVDVSLDLDSGARLG